MKRLATGDTRWMGAVAAILLLGNLDVNAGTIVAIDSPELFNAGDFDGDGRVDLVIVDKETGNYRLAHQLSPGNYTWGKSRASGIENVSSFSIGKLLSLTMDGLAFVGPDANRVNVLDASSATSAGLPLSFHPSTLGPNLVVALDIGGGGITPHDDLFLASLWNNSPANRLTLVRNNAGTMTELGTSSLAGPLEQGDRVVFKAGEPALAGAVRRDPANTFIAYRLTGGSAVIEASLSGLPPGAAYAWGQFAAAPFSQFLFYAPGQSNVLLRPVREPLPGTFNFGIGADFPMGDALAQVTTLAGSTPRLLVIFSGRIKVGVYDFDGTNAPTLRQQFNAAPGETFTSAGVLGGGHFMMYSSRDGSGRSTFFQAYNFNGSSFTAGAGGNLPPANALSARGNVMLFQREPFVAPGVNLLRSLNAGDWSSQLSALPGPVSVQTESFGGATQGLGSPAATSLGSSPPLAMFGLVNQYREQISLFNYGPANGDEISDVTISPAPGLYKKGISIALTASSPATQIYFRLNSTDAWTLYSAPLKLFKNTSVAYYGKPLVGSAKSRIKYATYTFTEPPSTLDSDGDGVPDYVEIARGLDPLGSGNDADGDGHFDLDELLAGTNPNDPNDPPPLPGVPAIERIPAVERQAAFDLVVTPRPWDGTVSNPTLSVTGTAVRAYNLAGSLLSYGKTTNTGLPGVTNPAARLMDISFEKEARLLAVATEEHFAIDTGGTNKLLGRELLGLLPLPALQPPFQVNYAYAGGTLATEANNWLAAAAASNALAHRAVFAMDLTIYDSLAALLTERKIGELLLTRGLSAASNLTLFSFRPTEANRFSPDLATLLSLESRGASNQPAYLLKAMQSKLQGMVMPGSGSAVDDLRLLTAEIYRLSSASNNAAPGVYPSPIDTLREFIGSGTLHSNYLARTTLSPAQRANAFSTVAGLLGNVPARPTTNIELRVRSDSFTSTCTKLETTGLVPTSKFLFHPGGEPYRLLEAFQLVPGARVQVFGFTDMSNSFCGGDGIEVITLQLSFVPEPSPTDLNGNLLADEWEALFGIIDPFADADGDGYSNLQELFEGTDPRDPRSKPAAPVASLSPPEITVETTGGGMLKLSWDWPEPYASKVKFHVLTTSALETPFADLGLMPTKTGGHFELSLPNPGTGVRFFLLVLSL